jgi:hypothetical protein
VPRSIQRTPLKRGRATGRSRWRAILAVVVLQTGVVVALQTFTAPIHPR